jgi:hypothetical protein
MDAARLIPYLAIMATRLLLTLLALLTGLAAQLTPAQARIRADGAATVSTIAASAQGERAVADRLAAPMRPEARHGPDLRRPATFAVKEADRAPTVMLGIDRARE